MSTWLALVLTDVIAVTTFARCFTGPGELTAALATLLAVHLAGFAARGGMAGIRATARIRPRTSDLQVPGPGRAGRGTAERSRPAARGGWWALGAVTAALLPVGIVLGSTFFWVVPAHATWHAASRDLHAAWRAFSFQVAPVPELPGLVLATAWAAGLAALLAELLSSLRKVPAVLALAPALGLYLFASALGTGSWRTLGLAAMAGSACWYLVAVVRERDASQDVLIASTDTGLSVGDRAASYGAGAVVVRMAALAALAAAVVGPNLPGARSVALVAWHGRGGGGRGTASTVVTGSVLLPQGVEISTLVQVAQEEVDNPHVALFTVYSSTPTRELIATLDTFNGEQWSESLGASQAVPSFYLPPAKLKADERNPPRATPSAPGLETLSQVFQVAALRGFNLPHWGYTNLVADADQVSRDGSSGSIVSLDPLQQDAAYDVRATVSDPSPAQLEADAADNQSQQDTQLPTPVPAQLTALANRLVKPFVPNTYLEALAIQNYLTGPRFHYQLPTRKNGQVVVPKPGYDDLINFLFNKPTGYCQQFATAFAVLARIEGIPTRIAVGFLAQTGTGPWTIEGIDTHAWPQVKFDTYGWIDFEPTPGATVEGSTAQSPSTTTSTTIPGTTATTLPKAHNLRPSSGGVVHPRTPKPAHHSHRSGGSSAPWLLVFPFALLAWSGGVPLWRRLRLRRAGRTPRAGILAAWGEALRTLDLAGIRRRRAETYLELAKRVASTGVLSEEAELALRDLARLATSASYVASPPGDAGTRQAMQDAKTVARSARRRVARWQRVAAALDPRSLPA